MDEQRKKSYQYEENSLRKTQKKPCLVTSMELKQLHQGCRFYSVQLGSEYIKPPNHQIDMHK